MKVWIWRCALVAAMAAATWMASAQRGAGASRPGDPQQDVQLPSGKSQRDEILKAEREQNIKDAAQLVDLARDLQQELEKNESYVLSMGTLKKTDEIEKLAKRIRTRLRHN